MPNKRTPIPRCPEFGKTYHLGCRCSFCREDHRKRRNAQRLRALERSRGVIAGTDRVDPTETAKLIRQARANGASDDELARVTGLATATIQKIRTRNVNFVLRDTADVVRRALQDNEDLRAFSDGSLVPAKWTRAMVHGLMAQGWPAAKQQELLRENLGVSGRFIFTAIRGIHDNLYYVNERSMYWLVSQIGNATGPSKRSMAFAERNGYFPTKHYDSKGELIVSSLPKEKRQGIEGV